MSAPDPPLWAQPTILSIPRPACGLGKNARWAPGEKRAFLPRSRPWAAARRSNGTVLPVPCVKSNRQPAPPAPFPRFSAAPAAPAAGAGGFPTYAAPFPPAPRHPVPLPTGKLPYKSPPFGPFYPSDRSNVKSFPEKRKKFSKKRGNFGRSGYIISVPAKTWRQSPYDVP